MSIMSTIMGVAILLVSPISLSRLNTLALKYRFYLLSYLSVPLGFNYLNVKTSSQGT